MTETAVIYLDNAASTPLDPAVLNVMNEAALNLPANPSATAHAAGRAAAQRVEQARQTVADAIGAGADEIIWTSGATEANNLAIRGAALAWQAQHRRPGHLITVVTEHRAVLDPVRQLEREGWRITRLPVSADGLLSLAALEQALSEDTALVSIMHVNNETGVIQDIAAIGSRLLDHAALLHVDAAQSLGKLALDVKQLGVDLLSLSAHKLHGPKGVGALYRRRRPLAPLSPLLQGGGQEQGLRAGTVATPLVVGMAEACRLACAAVPAEQNRLVSLRDRLWRALAELPEVHLNGAGAPRVAGLLNISVGGVHPEALLASVCGGADALAVSAGSACASSQGGSSYVLRALGRSPVLAASALRISMGRWTTEDEVDRAAAKIRQEICRLRALAEGQWSASVEASRGATAIPEPLERAFRQPLRAGRLVDDDRLLTGTAENLADGVWLQLDITVEADCIARVRHRVRGCPATMAAADWLALRLEGCRVESIHDVDWQAEFRERGLPPEKRGCLLLAEDALKAALADHVASRPPASENV